MRWQRLRIVSDSPCNSRRRLLEAMQGKIGLTDIEGVVKGIERIEALRLFDQSRDPLGLACEMEYAREVGVGLGVARFDLDPPVGGREGFLVLPLKKMDCAERLVDQRHRRIEVLGGLCANSKARSSA